VVWPILSAVVLVALIVAVAVVASHGSGSPVNQAQECSKVVYPVIVGSTIQGQGPLPTTSAGIMQWETDAVRQAARKASSDPPLANDLNAIATGLQQTGTYMADGNRVNLATTTSQLNRSFTALSALCPLSGGTSSQHPMGSGLPPGSGSGSLPTAPVTGQTPQCAAVQAIMGAGMTFVLTPGSSPAAAQPTSGPVHSQQVASYFGQLAEKYRHLAQADSSDPRLANDLNAVATDMQKISTTSGSGRNAMSEASQLEQDFKTLYTLCP
jgi:hypothetical protein